MGLGAEKPMVPETTLTDITVRLRQGRWVRVTDVIVDGAGIGQKVPVIRHMDSLVSPAINRGADEKNSLLGFVDKLWGLWLVGEKDKAVEARSRNIGAHGFTSSPRRGRGGE